MMGPIGFPKRPVRNYNYTLRKSPEEVSSHLLRGLSLISHNVCLFSRALHRGATGLTHSHFVWKLRLKKWQ